MTQSGLGIHEFRKSNIHLISNVFKQIESVQSMVTSLLLQPTLEGLLNIHLPALLCMCKCMCMSLRMSNV